MEEFTLQSGSAQNLQKSSWNNSSFMEKMFDMTRQGSDGLLPLAYRCIILQMEENRSMSQIPPPYSFSWTVSSAQLLLLAENSISHIWYTPPSLLWSPEDTQITQTPPIFAYGALKLPHVLIFISSSGETKIAMRFFFFLQRWCLLCLFLLPFPGPSSLQNMWYLTPVSSAEPHAVWISAY